MKALVKSLLANVRRHNVGNVYGGGHGFEMPHEHTCDLCGSKWKPGKREKHRARCLIRRTYEALGQKPPIVRVRKTTRRSMGGV